MTDTAGPATVVWWETGEQGRISSWLAVRAGSPPHERDAWVVQLAVSAGEPSAWAAVSWLPLPGLGAELAERLGHPLGDSRPGLSSVAFAAGGEPLDGTASADLYDECRATALALVAGRMLEPDVTTRPKTSGILLLRLRADGEAFVLDLAPAIDEPAWLGRPIDTGVGGGAEPTFGTTTVTLAGTEAPLPCAHLATDRTDAATVVLPKLWLPGAPEPIVHL